MVLMIPAPQGDAAVGSGKAAVLPVVVAALLCGAVLPGTPAPLAAASAAAQRPLQWPLDRPKEIVSSFGEYRYDHLHAGLDLSTGGATGVPVRAAGDGEVVRLKVEWRGYGRALYLRLRDGRRIVYGHLQRYEEKTLGLETRVERRRGEAGNRFPGNIEIDPGVTVRRGQVIAYTGESGVGPPHLHVEVRDAQDRPIDPLAAGFARPGSGPAPMFESLAVTSASADTLIDGRQRVAAFDLRRRDGIYEPDRPVVVSGPFDAAISAWDPEGGGRAGLASLEARVDGIVTYRFAPSRFGFEQGPIAGLLFDHRGSRLGPARYAYRLGRLPGNALAEGPDAAAAAVPGPTGSFALPPGSHRLEVIARSASGAVGRAAVTIRVEPAAAPGGVTPATGGAGGGDGAPGLQVDPLPRFLDLRLREGDAALASGLIPSAGSGAETIPAWRRLPGGLISTGLPYDALAQLGAAASMRLVEAAGAASIDLVDRARGLRREGEKYFVDLPAGSRFFSGPLVVRTAPVRDVPAGLVPLSPAVDLLPDGESLDAPGRIGFAPDGSTERAGVYRFDAGSGRWGFEADRVEAGSVVAPFRRYGRFALLRDDAAPVLLDVDPSAGRTVGSRPAITARVTDVGRGLDWDGVRFEVDGRALLAEYDPDRGVSKVLSAPAFSPGVHRLRVVATDRAGNVSAPIDREFNVRSTKPGRSIDPKPPAVRSGTRP